MGDTEGDRCPSCGGLWLDRGELAALLGAERDLPSAAAGSAAQGFLFCPQCRGSVMSRYLYHPSLDVMVDRCPRCRGIWLERGEFGAIRKKLPLLRGLASGRPVKRTAPGAPLIIASLAAAVLLSGSFFWYTRGDFRGGHSLTVLLVLLLLFFAVVLVLIALYRPSVSEREARVPASKKVGRDHAAPLPGANAPACGPRPEPEKVPAPSEGGIPEGNASDGKGVLEGPGVSPEAPVPSPAPDKAGMVLQGARVWECLLPLIIYFTSLVLMVLFVDRNNPELRYMPCAYGFIFLAFGALGTAAAFAWYIHTVLFVLSAKLACGRVVGYEETESAGSDDRHYRPVIQFHDTGGSLRQFTDITGSSPGIIPRGRVHVYYDPKDPAVARHRNWASLWGIFYCGGFIGMAFAMGGYVALLHCR